MHHPKSVSKITEPGRNPENEAGPEPGEFRHSSDSTTLRGEARPLPLAEVPAYTSPLGCLIILESSRQRILQ
jgi:hypothetical protein